ncbi:MAG: glycerate kinase type-2 family protein [Cyclonatronaceae bacterium]
MKPEQSSNLIEIYFRSLESLDPAGMILRKLRINNGNLTIGTVELPLYEGTHIWVMGAGKAAASMAAGVEEVLNVGIRDGIVIVPGGEQRKTDIVQQFVGEHPLPGPNSLAATLELINLSRKVTPGDIVLFLISGGASALMEYPADGIDPEDLITTVQLLLNCGANIDEMNTVRKHLSTVKGGAFLRNMRYARVLNLIVSDVPGDDVASVGSGPTNPDPSTFADARAVLDKYSLTEKMPQAVTHYISKGMDGEVQDTLKPGEPVDCEIHNHILATSADMADLVKRKLRSEGYSARGSGKPYTGMIGEIADTIFNDILKVQDKAASLKKPVALVYHGESYVQVTGNGKGGRNTELALRIAEKIAGMEDIVFMSVATDGVDGNTSAAGAICTGKTALAGEKMDMNISHYIADNDSWSYFKALGQIIHTGPTGNNLMDLQIALIGKS